MAIAPVLKTGELGMAQRTAQIITYCELLAELILPGMRKFAEGYLKQLLDDKEKPNGQENQA